MARPKILPPTGFDDRVRRADPRKNRGRQRIFDFPPALEVPPLTHREVEKYYKGDKAIWRVFQAFRRFDRWLRTTLLGKRYEFLLPGKIRR